MRQSTHTQTVKISIHALREEGDRRKPRKSGAIFISIHALREEGDYTILDILRHKIGFLSTPSARRATETHAGRNPAVKHFYPRPPRGGRHRKSLRFRSAPTISIHALREEGDGSVPPWYVYKIFLSTPSARRATQPLLLSGTDLFISIHALREEGDNRP